MTLKDNFFISALNTQSAIEKLALVLTNAILRAYGLLMALMLMPQRDPVSRIGSEAKDEPSDNFRLIQFSRSTTHAYRSALFPSFSMSHP